MKDNLPSLTCSICSHENLEDAEFCQNCGQPLTRICTNCNTPNAAVAKFCRSCGEALVMVASTSDDAQLRALQGAAPNGLQERIRVSSAQIEGERKPVTILFTDIVGSTSIAEKLDPEEWREIVSGAHRRVGEAIYRYEGTIAQLLGDGVLAFFGAPITHEDDPIRAVHAALDIQDAVADYERELVGMVDQFQMRVGINTGTVVIGDIGTDLHVEYLAIGDAVNLAARLQSAAEPGKVLLSENCARFVKATFELKDLGEIEVKGKSELIPVFEVLRAKIAPESGRGIEGLYSPLVGRERELNELLAALASLRKGHGQIFTLLGEAGIGKSRLLEEAKELAEKEPVDESLTHQPSSIRWLEGRSLSYGSTLSFWPINQLLLADLDLSEGDPEARIKVVLRRRMIELFGEESAEALPFLTHLLNLKQEEGAHKRIQRLDGETLKRQILLFLGEYFARVADAGPTVLVFEDMHWTDPSSLEALECLLSLTNRAPLMILMIMRIDRDHGSWQAKINAETDYAHRYNEIHLKRLSSIESDQMVNHLLEIAELPDKIRGLIMTRSEGNPFYLEELIRNLIDHGVIVRENHSWRAKKEIGEVTIPDTLQGVLLARIDRLEEDIRQTLQMASVIGKSFLYRLLEAVAEAERQLDTHLSQLQRADLVREKARWPDLEYVFKHSLTQEAVYQSILIERRKAFHLRVGESIEELFADRTEEFYGLLAHHFEAAKVDEKAVNYLLRAGDKTRLEDAHQEATNYYHRAIKLLNELKDDNRAARTWMKLGLIHQSNFEFDAVHKAYEAAFELEQRTKSQRISIGRAPKESTRIIRFSVSSRPGILDPGKVVNTGQAMIAYETFAGLAELDSESNVVPHAARSWEVLDDGKRYLFHLREDVRWTDGAQVTAGDFEWAWIRNLTLGADYYLAGILDEVVGARDYRLGLNTDPKSVGVRALDPTTLEVRLNTPVAYFIYLVTQSVTFPLPRAVIERYGDEWWKPEYVVSNGAFRLVQYDEDRGALERNPDYFAEFPGNLERIEFWITRQDEGRVQEYLEDLVDVAWNVPLRMIPVEVPLAEVHYPSHKLSTDYVVFDPSQPPLDDFRVRQALAHALDRGRILEAVGGPGLDPASGGVIPAGMPGHSPEIGLRHDVELARRYLAEAGYPCGKGFPALTLFVPDAPIMNAEIARQWREALGVETTYYIRTLEGDLSKPPDAHGSVGGWLADYPDPDSFLRQSHIYLNLRHWGWKNKHYDDLIEEAAHTPDRAQRLAMYRKADRILVAEEVLVIPFWYGDAGGSPDLVKPWVRNFRRNALGYIQFKDVTTEKN